MTSQIGREASAPFLVCLGVVALLLGVASPARAQDLPPQQTRPSDVAPSQQDQNTPASPDSTTPPTADVAPDVNRGTDPPTEPDSKNRIFGVMPNYTTVEGFVQVKPITGAGSFRMAALDSFDPFVYPLFGFIAGVTQLQNSPAAWGKGWNGYGKRYGAAFADNTVCSLVTTGLMPTLLRQDPRYYQGRATGFFHRFAYAASRSAVTRSRTGNQQFNASEIGGTLIVANVSNLYYPPDERNTKDTMVRWGTQTMWDTVANELKEFWPDIRRGLHKL